MGTIDLHDSTRILYAALQANGAFLVTVDPSGRPNPMTIGWGLVGIGVRKPVFSVYLTRGGYTHESIRQAESFTVSVPAEGTMSQELGICGKHSGRDTDKVTVAGLQLIPGREVDAQVVDGCAVYYECVEPRADQRENGDLLVFGRISALYAAEAPL